MHSRSDIGAAFFCCPDIPCRRHFSQKYQFDDLGLCKLVLGQIDPIKNRTTAELSPRGHLVLLG